MAEISMKDELDMVWQGIGPDVLSAVGEDETGEISGAEVQDVVGDNASSILTGEALATWTAASWDQRKAWLEEAFPAEQRYGW